MPRSNPYGTRAKVAQDNDPAYVKLAQHAISRLRAVLGEAGFADWKQRTFDQRTGVALEQTAARFVWIAALNELNRKE